VYLPSVGFFAAVAAGGALLLRRIPRTRPARLVALAALLVAIVLAVATLQRNAVWASDVSLWADSALKSPNKVRPLGNLAAALDAAGYHEEGVGVLRRAATLEPRNAIIRGQLGAALASLGRTGEAELEIREAIQLDPSRPEPVFNLGLLLSRTGRAAEGQAWFRRFLEIAPPSYVNERRIAAAAARR
jgi:Flp pilus assembly protein TadD